MHRLFLERCDVVAVLAADPVPLNIPPSVIRIKPRLGATVHPREIAAAYNWPYYVVDHRSAETLNLLQEHQPDLGIIAGARILPNDVINAVRIGVVNFHPAILPDGRGLDALPWAILENRPIGVTAHFIDSKVDAGRFVLKREIQLFPDDTLIDISLRLQDTQVEMIPDVLSSIAARSDFPVCGPGKLHRKMPAELELQIPHLFQQRLREFFKSDATRAPILIKKDVISG